MKDYVKATLLSALVLPGVGQIYRGRVVKGGVLIALVSLVLLVFVVLAALALQEILQVVRVSGSLDAVAVAEKLRVRMPAFLWLGGILVSLWIYGVIDAFLERSTDGGVERGE